MKRVIIVLGVVALMVMGVFGAIAKPQPDKKVVYKTVCDVKLELHIFNPVGHKASDKMPAIVFFFGGGWVGGSPSQFYQQSAYLASRGMVAACAQYRTKKGHKTTPVECVKDGKSAIRWMRIHATGLGINPNMLAASGGSAGGHVAAATGTLKGFEENGEDMRVSSRPNALVLFNPVYDNGPKGYGYERVKKYWKDFSPMEHIDANTPPTTVFFGDKDSLVPVATARKYKALMEKFGVRSDLHLYKGQLHGFFNKSKYYETVLEADKFLTSLGYLKGEPTLKK